MWYLILLLLKLPQNRKPRLHFGGAKTSSLKLLRLLEVSYRTDYVCNLGLIKWRLLLYHPRLAQKHKLLWQLWISPVVQTAINLSTCRKEFFCFPLFLGSVIHTKQVRVWYTEIFLDDSLNKRSNWFSGLQKSMVLKTFPCD